MLIYKILYDVMIIGTSIIKNFKTSEFDKLFNVNSIKVIFLRDSHKEITNKIKRIIRVVYITPKKSTKR